MHIQNFLLRAETGKVGTDRKAMYNLGFSLKIMLTWGPPSPYIMVTGSLSRGVKRQGRGFDHPAPSVN